MGGVREVGEAGGGDVGAVAGDGKTELVLETGRHSAARDECPAMAVVTGEGVEGGAGALQAQYIGYVSPDFRRTSAANAFAPIVLGHLELVGFEMFRGSVSTHGDSPDLFGRFDLVCSGHYHHKSDTGNIHYLGSHSQFTWSDYGDDRGFHILDTETKELEFVKNPYEMFAKVWYDDRKDTDINVDLLKNRSEDHTSELQSH